MDIRSLISQLDLLEKKQILNESQEFEQDQLEINDEQSDNTSEFDLKGSIFKTLLKEFNLKEADARAINQVKAMLKPNGQGIQQNGSAIDPNTGIIYYADESGEGGLITPKATPYKWYEGGQDKQFYDTLKAAGLTIKPVEQKNLFGKSIVAAVDTTQLNNIVSGKPAQPAAPMPSDDARSPDGSAGMAPSSGSWKPGQAAAAVNRAAPTTAAPAADFKLDPAKIKRFQELLDKIKGGSTLTRPIARS